MRQKGSRKRRRVYLSIRQFQSLLKEQTEQPARMMVILAGTLGLSRSEITGLKWGDFDWGERKLALQRGVVNGHVGDTKNEFRDRAIPVLGIRSALPQYPVIESGCVLSDLWCAVTLWYG